ncbi:transporter substrate-binding domain-containing protein [Cupriavidus basilensis]
MLGTLPWLMATGLPAHAADGDTLAQARARGTLRCGVSEGIAGFSAKDASGRWSGIDVDFCRAVAAAALGQADKVTFVPLKASGRFPALRTGVVDLLSRNTTWTLARESTLRVQFAGILYYDGQAFMVSRQNGIRSIAGLDHATVCVEKGTSSEDHLATYSAANRLSVKPLVVDSATEVADAFSRGAAAPTPRTLPNLRRRACASGMGRKPMSSCPSGYRRNRSDRSCAMTTSAG